MGVSSFFDLHWASVGWSEEAANKAGMPVKTIVLPVRTRDNAMPLGKDGYWKVVISKEKAAGLKEGQIIGFQAVIEGDPVINLSERFLDIITAKESISRFCATTLLIALRAKRCGRPLPRAIL